MCEFGGRVIIDRLDGLEMVRMSELFISMSY